MRRRLRWLGQWIVYQLGQGNPDLLRRPMHPGRWPR